MTSSWIPRVLLSRLSSRVCLHYHQAAWGERLFLWGALFGGLLLQKCGGLLREWQRLSCATREVTSRGGGGGFALQGRRSVINFAWVSLPSCVCLVLFGRNNSSGRKWIPGMNDEAAVKNDPHFQYFQEVTASSYRKITFRMFDQLHAWHLWVSALHFRGFQQ